MSKYEITLVTTALPGFSEASIKPENYDGAELIKVINDMFNLSVASISIHPLDSQP